MNKNTTNDLIQTCDLIPCEDVTRRLLEICHELNTRLSALENRGLGIDCCVETPDPNRP